MKSHHEERCPRKDEPVPQGSSGVGDNQAEQPPEDNVGDDHLDSDHSEGGANSIHGDVDVEDEEQDDIDSGDQEDSIPTNNSSSNNSLPDLIHPPASDRTPPRLVPISDERDLPPGEHIGADADNPAEISESEGGISDAPTAIVSDTEGHGQIIMQRPQHQTSFSSPEGIPCEETSSTCVTTSAISSLSSVTSSSSDSSGKQQQSMRPPRKRPPVTTSQGPSKRKRKTESEASSETDNTSATTSTSSKTTITTSSDADGSRSNDTSGDQSHDTSSDQSHDKSDDQSHDRTGDESHDKTDDQSHDPSNKPPCGASGDQLHDNAVVQSHDTSDDQSHDPGYGEDGNVLSQQDMFNESHANFGNKNRPADIPVISEVSCTPAEKIGSLSLSLESTLAPDTLEDGSQSIIPPSQHVKGFVPYLLPNSPTACMKGKFEVHEDNGLAKLKENCEKMEQKADSLHLFLSNTEQNTQSISILGQKNRICDKELKDIKSESTCQTQTADAFQSALSSSKTSNVQRKETADDNLVALQLSPNKNHRAELTNQSGHSNKQYNDVVFLASQDLALRMTPTQEEELIVTDNQLQKGQSLGIEAGTIHKERMEHVRANHIQQQTVLQATDNRKIECGFRLQRPVLDSTCSADIPPTKCSGLKRTTVEDINKLNVKEMAIPIHNNNDDVISHKSDVCSDHAAVSEQMTSVLQHPKAAIQSDTSFPCEHINNALPMKESTFIEDESATQEYSFTKLHDRSVEILDTRPSSEQDTIPIHIMTGKRSKDSAEYVDDVKINHHQHGEPVKELAGLCGSSKPSNGNGQQTRGQVVNDPYEYNLSQSQRDRRSREFVLQLAERSRMKTANSTTQDQAVTMAHSYHTVTIKTIYCHTVTVQEERIAGRTVNSRVINQSFKTMSQSVKTCDDSACSPSTTRQSLSSGNLADISSIDASTGHGSRSGSNATSPISSTDCNISATTATPSTVESDAALHQKSHMPGTELHSYKHQGEHPRKMNNLMRLIGVNSNESSKYSNPSDGNKENTTSMKCHIEGVNKMQENVMTPGSHASPKNRTTVNDGLRRTTNEVDKKVKSRADDQLIPENQHVNKDRDTSSETPFNGRVSLQWTDTGQNIVSPTLDTKNLRLGTPVYAMWRDKHYYPAHVLSISKSKYCVIFEDGDSCQVKESDIIVCEILPEGQEVLATSNSSDYIRGVVTEVKYKDGKKGCTVKFEDGSFEFLTRKQIILDPKQAKSFKENIVAGNMSSSAKSPAIVNKITKQTNVIGHIVVKYGEPVSSLMTKGKKKKADQNMVSKGKYLSSNTKQPNPNTLHNAKCMKVTEGTTGQNVDEFESYKPNEPYLPASSLVPAGTLVYAMWHDKHFYPGSVTGKEEGTGKLSINFDDGDVSLVSKSDIIVCELVSTGQEVFAERYPNEGHEQGMVSGHYKKGHAIGYIIEFLDMKQEQVPRSAVMLHSEQARALISALRGPLCSPQKSMADLSLDNLVDGKRRRKTPKQDHEKGKNVMSNKKNGSGDRLTKLKTKGGSPKKKRKLLAPNATSTPTPKRREKSPNNSYSPSVSQVMKTIPDFRHSPGKSKTVLFTDHIKGPIPEKGSRLFEGITFILTFVDKLSDQVKQNHGNSHDITQEEEVPFDKDHLRKQIKAGGGIILDQFDICKVNAAKCCYLVSNTCHRTLKYLCSLAAGLPCLSHVWIKDACCLGQCPDIKAYFLPAGFSIEKNEFIEWTNNRGDLHGINIYLTSTNKRFLSLWKPVLESSPCNVVEKLPSSRQAKLQNIHVISDRHCDPKVTAQSHELGLHHLSSEWLIQCLISGQKVSYNGHPKYRWDYQD